MGILLTRVIPNAKKTSCEGLMDDGKTVKIRLAAPPVEGKANETLVRWLAEKLGVRRSDITLLSGKQSREKRLAIEGRDEAAIHSRLFQ